MSYCAESYEEGEREREKRARTRGRETRQRDYSSRITA